MAIFFKTFIRRCAQQRKSLFLMEAMIQEFPKDADESLKNKDLMSAHVAFFPQFVNEAAEPFKGAKDVFKRFEEMCYYNGINREFYGTLAMVTSYEVFEKPNNLTNENLKVASMLFWIFEMVTTSMIMIDSCLDNQMTRWKKLCWHQRPDVGMSIVADCRLLRSAGFYMLKKYFQNHPSYMSLFHLLSDLITELTLGQILDLEYIKYIKTQGDLRRLTLDKYAIMMKHRAYAPIIKMPMLATLHLTNSHKKFNKFEHIMAKLGLHTQVINDMWDCYGSYESYGKTGNDIVEGKFSWLLAQVIEHGSDEQIRLLQNNYGKPERKCQEMVESVYKEINMLEIYSKYKTKLLEDIYKDAKKLDDPEVFNLVRGYADICVDVNDNFIVPSE